MNDMDVVTNPVQVTNDNGDHERFAHYIFSPKGKSPYAVIMYAMVNSKPVKALCGKVWIPSRDPKNFPICPECDEVRTRALLIGKR